PMSYHLSHHDALPIELPAGDAGASAVASGARLAGALTGNAVADTTDAAELLDIDVQQLAGTAALEAVGGLGRLEPGALAEPDPAQHRRDGRQRHRQHLRDLGRRHPQPPQGRDRLHTLLGRAVRDRTRRRGTIDQPVLALDAI